MISRRFITFILMLLISVPLLNCEKPSPAGGEGTEEGAEQLPPIDVKLPPSPTFQKEHPPEVYPDGAFSVYGVRKNLKDLLKKKVRAKAYLLEVYECPPCPKGSQCPPCAKPHFWVTDRAGGAKDQALLVTDYITEINKSKRKRQEAEMSRTLVVGKPFYVSGTLARSSESGFSNSEGLIIFESIAPIETQN